MAGPYLKTVFEESVSAVTSTNTVKVGTVRKEGLNEYLYVYNMSTSTIGVGYGAVHSAASAYSVTVSSVTGDFCVGAVKHAQIGPNQYGWLCTKGPCALEIGDTVIGNHTSVVGAGAALMSDGAWYSVTTGATGSTWAHTTRAVWEDTVATNASGTAILL